jgi:hypothetical protein
VFCCEILDQSISLKWCKWFHYLSVFLNFLLNN